MTEREEVLEKSYNDMMLQQIIKQRLQPARRVGVERNH